MSVFLYQSFVYLCAAVLVVPLAQRFGFGSVLGYLLAGVAIGPVLGLVGTEAQALQHYAEFGVVMMLFLVGLELQPQSLWRMRSRLFGLGGLQLALSALLIALVASLLGLPWQSALAVGMILALSSTAIGLQSLKEKSLLPSPGGQSAFSILLFQDIAVIPMLAFIPLLAIPELVGLAQPSSEAGHHELSLVADLLGWQVALVNLGAIAAVVLTGHYLSRPLFSFIARSKSREIFTLAALLLVIGIALLMTLVGLSPALGVFLAGVVLANSEFRHELEGNIEPFKGLLLGLFFITVGAGIDFNLLFANFTTIMVLSLGLMLLKALVLLGIVRLFALRGADAWLTALALAQAGEFGFVLTAFALQNGVLAVELGATLALIVALSMLFTPLLFIVYERFILPRAHQQQARAADAITERGKVIIAGHGRFGQIINRVLLANGYKTVVLDYRAELIDVLRKFGAQVFYGDAARPELLHASGLESAQLVVVAIDDPEGVVKLVQYVRSQHPQVHIIARASDRQQVYRLYRAGANDIIRELFDSSARAARCALQAMGLSERQAQAQVDKFVAHDKMMIRELAEVWDPELKISDNKQYIAVARRLNAELGEVMQRDDAEPQGSR